MHHAVLFLLADIDDFLRPLIPLAIFIFWVVSQLLSKKGGVAQPKKPGAPRPGPQPPREAVPDKLSNEIEKFLRRAAQKQAGQQPEEAVAEPVVVAQMVEPDEPPRRLVTAELISAEPIEQVPSGRGVAAHVEEHVGGSAFEERTSRLGEEVGLADDKLEDRLHATFDHQVGRLSGLPSATTGAALTQDPYEDPYEDTSGDDESERGVDPISAGDVSPISPIFSGPEDIRRAIILHEILQRPEDRW